MSSSLWLSIEPRSTETQLLLSVAGSGPSLKARLPTRPAHPHALVRLMEALACWYRLPLHAVLDADASDVVRDAESWAQWTGDVSTLDVRVEWVGKARRGAPRERFLDGMGSFDSAKRRIAFASGGTR
jgi:hypothetical protein